MWLAVSTSRGRNADQSRRPGRARAAHRRRQAAPAGRRPISASGSASSAPARASSHNRPAATAAPASGHRGRIRARPPGLRPRSLRGQQARPGHQPGRRAVGAARQPFARQRSRHPDRAVRRRRQTRGQVQAVVGQDQQVVSAGRQRAQAGRRQERRAGPARTRGQRPDPPPGRWSACRRCSRPASRADCPPAWSMGPASRSADPPGAAARAGQQLRAARQPQPRPAPAVPASAAAPAGSRAQAHRRRGGLLPGTRRRPRSPPGRRVPRAARAGRPGVRRRRAPRRRRPALGQGGVLLQQILGRLRCPGLASGTPSRSKRPFAAHRPASRCGRPIIGPVRTPAQPVQGRPSAA